MPESVHGHAVLEILLAAPEPLTQDALRAITAERFGPDARYHTCAADGLSIDGLVEFLLARGKVTTEDGALVAHREEMCAHE